MYGFLFDQAYITMAIFGLLIFLIMFLWRKITIIEGHIFILEKRVDTIKKADRIDSINKNIESADIVMNEIFKDSTDKNTYCNNNSNKCPIDKIKNNINNVILPPHRIPKNNQGNQGNQGDDIINYINILNSGEIDKEIPETISITKYIKENTEIDPENMIKEGIVNNTNNDNLEYIQESIVNTDNIQDIITISSPQDIVDADNISVSSDITFGNEVDKTLTKKYKNMNVEKLREECKEKSLNTEGTKAVLISRILEHNKKQK
jgi:hypothetical protein